MKVWSVIKRPLDVEPDLPFGKSQASENVKDKYSNHQANELVAYISNENECGFIRLNRSIVFQASAKNELCISIVKPAKGAGRVSLSVRSNEQDVSILSSRYSEKSLEWLKTVQKTLEKSFEIKPIIEELGFDT